MRHPAQRGWLPVAAVLAVPVVALGVSGCGANDPAAQPMATPSLTLNSTRVPLGNPVEMTYTFVVAKDAKFTKDYRVMVHFADRDEGLLYSDDHDPPVPTSAWAPGQTVEYRRTWFAPVYPYLGDATIEIGLYCQGCALRAPLAGVDTGHRSYRVAHLQFAPQAEGVAVGYTDGWYALEGAENSGEGAWRWTKKDARLAVRNPKKDSVLYLKVGNPGGAFTEPQHVTVSLDAGAPLDQFTTSSNQKIILRTIPISAAAWGTRDMAELRLSVDKSFVPNRMSPSFSDPRELGIRVFRAVVVPSGP